MEKMKLWLRVIKPATLLPVLIVVNTIAYGQTDIPPGTWRMHLSFNELRAVAVAPNVVYGAAPVGIMQLDKSDHSVTTITGINGLHGSDLTCISFDPQRNILLAGHEDGSITLIKENSISLFTRFSSSNSITGSKRINHILIFGSLAYMGTDFGIVAFSLDQLEVKETYRDLGVDGVNTKINEVVILNDSIFAATDLGVIAGALSGTNLLDFRNWKRYDEGDLTQHVNAIATFNNQLFIAIDMSGIYRLENGTWIKQAYLQGVLFKSLTGSTERLVVSTSSSVVEIDANNSDEEISSTFITKPSMAVHDGNGNLWIADCNNGLVGNSSGEFESFKPNGPSSNYPWRLIMNESLVNLHGGYNTNHLPSDRQSTIDIFSNGQWSTKISNLPADVTDFVPVGEIEYYSSFGHGVEQVTSSGIVIFDETNSLLTNANPPARHVFVPSLASSADGVWVANYDSSTPLNLLKDGSQWSSFSFATPQASFPQEIEVDNDGRVWMLIDPARGGGVFVYDDKQQKSVYLSNVAGNGGLPSMDVRSIAFDREGQIWFGTSQGVAYLNSSISVFNTSVDALRPIFENRFLLRDEIVTAIAVDGGNRKWMGTKNGAWLFDATGETLITNFNTSNSPLPSNNIVDIAVNNLSGEVFISTERGLVSFRSNATKGAPDFKSVKIFPNPITRDFGGTVAITGLYTDAQVKITDIAGRLIWEMKANGGTASWNVRQLNGNRVATGMYLVFSTTQDGSEKHVGKIAVID